MPRARVLGSWVVCLMAACVPPTGGGSARKDGGNVVLPGADGGAGNTDADPGGGTDALDGDGGATDAALRPDVPAVVRIPDCAGNVCGPDGCGGTCDDGDRCVDDRCTGEDCPEGTQDCTGVCSDVETDADNCGACGSACERRDGVVTVCIDRQCYLQCPEMEGEPVSVNLSSDPSNCGACGRDCPSAEGGFARCIDGECLRQLRALRRGLRGHDRVRRRRVRVPRRGRA